MGDSVGRSPCCVPPVFKLTLEDGSIKCYANPF